MLKLLNFSCSRCLFPSDHSDHFLVNINTADLALAMSHVNSEPRGALGFATPARAFRAMPGEDAAALLDAYGVGDVPLGDLDLTPGLIERARAERGDAPLA